MRRPGLPAACLGVGAAALVVVLVTALPFSKPDAVPGGSAGAAAAPAVAPGPPRDPLDAAIGRLQEHLRRVPADGSAWAQLGTAYVQQARVSGDPTYYPKAEGALRRSLTAGRADRWPAMVGLGALANARHQFAEALQWGHRAEALNPRNATVHAVLADAQTQLGDDRAARDSVRTMLRLQPGIPAFTRASYVFEQQGDVAAARLALQRALDQASEPSDIAFCRYYLGELAFNGGDPAAALLQYEAGLRADPRSAPPLAGRAKAEAALGRTAEALRDYETVATRVPLPQYLLEYGELLQSLGHGEQAAQQYQVLVLEQRLAEANGVVDGLTAAVVAADHGSPATAVAAARAEWGRRRSVLVADALGWALHRAGQDSEALHYATAAGRLGWRNATFSYHRGMIELSLGHRAAARGALRRALALNPHFSPLLAPAARRALAALGGGR